MTASLFQPHIWTANLLFIGLVRGLIVSLLVCAYLLYALLRGERF